MIKMIKQLICKHKWDLLEDLRSLMMGLRFKGKSRYCHTESRFICHKCKKVKEGKRFDLRAHEMYNKK